MRYYRMTITPALKPEDRHQIQDALSSLGYTVHGGGTCIDMTCCDISFSREGGEKKMAKQKPKLTRKDKIAKVFHNARSEVKKAPVVTKKKPAKKKK
ncbi:MAG: hypothetical protein V1690_03800 [Candidatus Moraniibacteriota bacterium]